MVTLHPMLGQSELRKPQSTWELVPDGTPFCGEQGLRPEAPQSGVLHLPLSSIAPPCLPAISTSPTLFHGARLLATLWPLLPIAAITFVHFR